MTIREIPLAYEHKCDGCGLVHTSNSKSRPAYWCDLVVAQDAYDYHGCAVADGTIRRHLCAKCKDTVVFRDQRSHYYGATPMTHTADDMHDDTPMTQAVSAEAVAGLVKRYRAQDIMLAWLYNRAPDPHPNGSYVKFEAYTSLAAEVEALKREREQWAAVANREDECRQMWQARTDSLASELAQCREALAPFATYLDQARFDLDNNGDPLPDDHGMGWVYLTVGDFRRARSLMADTTSTVPNPGSDEAIEHGNAIRERD